MNILSSINKNNDGTLWAMDLVPRSYVSVYQFDMFVGLNLEIDPTTKYTDTLNATGASMWSWSQTDCCGSHVSEAAPRVSMIMAYIGAEYEE